MKVLIRGLSQRFEFWWHDHCFAISTSYKLFFCSITFLADFNFTFSVRSFVSSFPFPILQAVFGFRKGKGKGVNVNEIQLHFTCFFSFPSPNFYPNPQSKHSLRLYLDLRLAQGFVEGKENVGMKWRKFNLYFIHILFTFSCAPTNLYSNPTSKNSLNNALCVLNAIL